MRGVWAPLALIAAAACVAQQSQAVESMRIEANGLQSLQDSLLEFAQRLLRPNGVIIDGRATRLMFVDERPAHGVFQVRPLWTDAVATPLMFELVRVGAGSSASPIQVTLAVKLQKQVWVAGRRLQKGSPIACRDLITRVRDVSLLPPSSLDSTCELDASARLLRELAPGDVIRSSDVGQLPDVISGMPVRVSVAAGAINVTTVGTALADANAGDRIDVRLEHPLRTLRTRVIGPGAVQLMDEPT